MARITDEQCKTFLAEVVEVERRHGLAISHEDGHGAFLVERFSDDLAEWLTEAQAYEPIPPSRLLDSGVL